MTNNTNGVAVQMAKMMAEQLENMTPEDLAKMKDMTSGRGGIGGAATPSSSASALSAGGGGAPMDPMAAMQDPGMMKQMEESVSTRYIKIKSCTLPHLFGPKAGVRISKARLRPDV
jgi:hypothetical protein